MAGSTREISEQTKLTKPTIASFKSAPVSVEMSHEANRKGRLRSSFPRPQINFQHAPKPDR